MISVFSAIGGIIAQGTLLVADYYLRYSLRVRAGQRAQARTKRIRFPAATVRRISSRQGNFCMYCGVRLKQGNRQIDHIYPVEFGGSNEESNLQALCGSCNARKGVQTDSDFRARYRDALIGVRPGNPPAFRIPYSRFNSITRRTKQGETTRALRKAIFITPKQKIMAGSTAAAVVWPG